MKFKPGQRYDTLLMAGIQPDTEHQHVTESGSELKTDQQLSYRDINQKQHKRQEAVKDSVKSAFIGSRKFSKRDRKYEELSK